MHSIRHIMVVLKAEQSDSLPLKRAKYLASALQAELHLLLCDTRHDHAVFLRRLSGQLVAEGFRVTTEQHASDHLHPTNGILDSLRTRPCGLVIKQHYPDNPLTHKLLTPDDWKLLRQSPVPVLMTKTDRPWDDGVVLAAMDIDNDESEHRNLQGSIIAHAVDLAALIHGSVHAVCAYPETPFSAADPCAPRYDGNAHHCLEACRWFQEEYQLRAHQIHVAEGPAKALITQFAHQLEVAVTVIGTVGRSGLAGAWIGNTAEAVLNRIDSDVLILKPHDPDLHLLEPLEEGEPLPEQSRVSA
ncbi:universal stress protein [Pseudomonas sp. SA3-5]|uniref:Universal stress protein n=1 Tax=Pseudomonas aestuarii TaxID=3018340 RepID=A0ABT4XEC0_9PSED|nr:universal stress protein [Pseudomonas aestuarii]MDA7086560.1 universal stress protein [Pseudomonas aestuarii]